MTPPMPMIAGGIGSVMSPAITVTKSAKYRHALTGSPAGVGASRTIAPRASGIATLSHDSRSGASLLLDT